MVKGKKVLAFFICFLFAWHLPLSIGAITFTDIADESGVHQISATWGIQWGDVNGDGYQDIYVNNHQYIRTYTDQQVPPTLFINNGNGTFTDDSVEYGIIPWGDQHGAAFGDYNNDGFLDLFQTQGSNQEQALYSNFLYKNTGLETFENIAESAGIDMPLARGRGACWFDYNNDGFIDLFIANVGTYPSSLFKNNRDGTFTDVGPQTGLAGLNIIGCTPIDYNNDGLDDLFGISKDNIFVLFKNNGNETYTEVSASAGLLTSQVAPKDFCWGDYDNDMDMDLYIASSIYRDAISSESNKISYLSSLHNGEMKGIDFESTSPNVTFEIYNYMGKVDPEIIYIGANGIHPTANSFVLRSDDPQVQGQPTFIQDISVYIWFDNQWHIRFTTSISDLQETSSGYITTDGQFANINILNFNFFDKGSIIPNRLYENQGNGTFMEVATQSGIADITGSNACKWADFDNDGFLDLYVVNAGQMFNESNRLYMNNGNKTFTDMAISAGVEANVQGRGESAAIGDYNNDGFLDLFVVNGFGEAPFSYGPHILFHNNGNGNNWLNIKLIGTASNRDAIGSKVKIKAGGKVQLRQQTGGASVYSQNSSVIHFGLGNIENIYGIQVIWPSGVIQEIPNIIANQFITLKEPAVLLSISPINTTVIAGDKLSYKLTLKNQTDRLLTFDYWTHYVLPDGSTYPLTGEALGPISVTLDSHKSVTRTIFNKIPAKTPQGIYTYKAYVGQYPTIWEESGFDFTVTVP